MGSTIAPSFATAMRARVSELRAELDEHPTSDLLRSFRDGKLNAFQDRKISDHIAICELCRLELLRLDRLSLEEQESAWQRLTQRLTDRRSPWRPISRESDNGRLAVERLIAVARHIAEALAQVHARGGVIRDLRPETVLLTGESKSIRFIDLGAAALPMGLEAGHGKTEAEVLNESIRCASPEQILGERLDRRSNIFSLGAVLYELTTGIAPFHGPNLLETAGRIVALEPLPLSHYRKDVPAPFERLIGLMMSQHPQKRPKSAAAVFETLTAIEAGVEDPLRSLYQSENSEAEIEALYRQIDALMSRQSQGEELGSEIKASMDRLRTLQKAEADELRATFERHSSMPDDAGEKILARTKQLRRKLESLTAPDLAPG